MTSKEINDTTAISTFIDETINLIARGINLYSLPQKYAYNTVNMLINKSGLNDAEKKQHREHFANAVVFTGMTYVSAKDLDSAIKARDAIINKLEGNKK